MSTEMTKQWLNVLLTPQRHKEIAPETVPIV